MRQNALGGSIGPSERNQERTPARHRLRGGAHCCDPVAEGERRSRQHHAIEDAARLHRGRPLGRRPGARARAYRQRVLGSVHGAAQTARRRVAPRQSGFGMRGAAGLHARGRVTGKADRGRIGVGGDLRHQLQGACAPDVSAVPLREGGHEAQRAGPGGYDCRRDPATGLPPRRDGRGHEPGPGRMQRRAGSQHPRDVGDGRIAALDRSLEHGRVRHLGRHQRHVLAIAKGRDRLVHRSAAPAPSLTKEDGTSAAGAVRCGAALVLPCGPSRRISGPPFL